MDKDCISSIIKFIKQSDMTELGIKSVEIRPIICNAEKDEDRGHVTSINVSDTMFFNKPSLSEAWIAGNLLLFTVFDGYLENECKLVEGASFRQHYNGLPESTNLEIISKNCYRIIKIIRNAIQHNLSCVIFDQGNYDISYKYNNTQYELSLSSMGVENLYTLIMNIIQGKVSGINAKYHTKGHYEGIICTQYSELIKGIKRIADDITGDLINVSCLIKLRAIVRYPVENPIIIAEDENTITFKHIENNSIHNENSSQYYYSTDYIYKEFLIPQEIGVITEDKDNFLITFKKNQLEDKWKMINN
nr:hypothetical protein [uncultured Lachnoanaerobaculum sp.]